MYLLALNLSPFLKMAVTFAERRSTGTSPSTKVLQNISVRIEANSSAKSFRIREGIMSGPDALLGWIFLSSFRTPSLSGIGGYGCPSGCGMFASSYRVNVDSCCLLSMFDLSSGSACMFPFSLSGATPLLSFRRGFI